MHSWDISLFTVGLKSQEDFQPRSQGLSLPAPKSGAALGGGERETLGTRLKDFFSNSLIIHKEKTKEITTVTVVWIPDLNKHKIFRTSALNFSKNYEWFKKPYQKIERVFHQVSKHLEVG